MCSASSILSLTMAEIMWKMSSNATFGGTDSQIITMSVVVVLLHTLRMIAINSSFESTFPEIKALEIYFTC